jgi:hypothetical protein
LKLQQSLEALNVPVNLKKGEFLPEKVIGSILPKKLRNVARLTRQTQATPAYKNQNQRNTYGLITPSKSAASFPVVVSHKSDVEV